MTGRLSRRVFLVGGGGLGLAAGCSRWPWPAQTASKVYRVGYLGSDPTAPEHEAFRQGLRELGYVAGQNIVLEYRWADRAEQFAGFTADLLGSPVDIIVAAGGTSSARAAQQAPGVPIVFIHLPDPVATGLVASLARPGGNITGLSNMGARLNGKRLELFTAALPHVSRMAHIFAVGRPDVFSEPGVLSEQEAQAAAEVLGIELLTLAVRQSTDVAGALAEAIRWRAGALWPDGSPPLLNQREPLLDFAAQNRLPVLAPTREFVEQGGLMSYAASRIGNFRRAATYVDKILKGTHPADLPVEQPMTFEFVVNLKTAQTLDITFPNEILLQVTEVIQ
jgi:putative ABC transport system substrate-binding protein